MAETYTRIKKKKNNVLLVLVSVILICAVIVVALSSIYVSAKQEAFEMLHMQTKQIKDDLTLQIKSDRENLITMANFAAKLHSDGESYDIMFESFKPIGLFSNIGILNPDNTFVTKVGTINLDGKISFEAEAARGEYVSGRVPDLTRDGGEIIRSAVPIIDSDKVVGILYGVIHLDTIGEKYNNMAKELDAQLFVYDKETGKFVIDTIDKNLGELSQFKDREFKDGYSYDELVNSDKGYSSFRSILVDEDLYIHYSTIEDFGWGIMLARYENQVFAQTHKIAYNLIVSDLIIIFILAFYLNLVLSVEKSKTKLNAESSTIRKLLLEANDDYSKITESIKKVQEYSHSRSAFFANTEGEEYVFIDDDYNGKTLVGDASAFFFSELFAYATKVQKNNTSSITFMRIVPNKHLAKTNPALYDVLKEYEVTGISFAIIAEKNNHMSLLGVNNPRRDWSARTLLEDIAICFSIAINNRKYLHNTKLAATTDSLTGALNRAAYSKDIHTYNETKPERFSCIFIDVNELHIRNNKYGHAAGDSMLIYIANTLKNVFFGNRVYRMGGDEFLVFAENVDQDTINQNIDIFVEQLAGMGYNVSIGMSYRTHNTSCEELVREAEIRMYEAKSQYYQNKSEQSVTKDKADGYVCIQTGIKEIDTMISTLKDHYNGIYRVSLDTDSARRILMPSYLGYREYEENFSKLVSQYIESEVQADYHRAFTSFLNYAAIKRHISEDKIPSITYQKVNRETVTLSVYNLSDDKNNANDTLWIFAKG